MQVDLPAIRLEQFRALFTIRLAVLELLPLFVIQLLLIDLRQRDANHLIEREGAARAEAVELDRLRIDPENAFPRCPAHNAPEPEWPDHKHHGYQEEPDRLDACFGQAALTENANCQADDERPADV